MQGYGNYNNGGMNGNRNYIGPNNYGNAVNPGNVGNIGNIGWNNNSWGYQANGYNQAPMQTNGRIYVTGRAGADAYQLSPGVTEQVLWDDDAPRFYVKGYDEKGRPRVLEDNDYLEHDNHDGQQETIDMSKYATKDDIKVLIADAIKKIKMPNLSGYVTDEMLNSALSELCVGSGGKVVRSGELDA